MITTKDFITAAHHVRQISNMRERRIFAHQLAELFPKMNNRFIREDFLEACAIIPHGESCAYCLGAPSAHFKLLIPDMIDNAVKRNAIAETDSNWVCDSMCRARLAAAIIGTMEIVEVKE